MVGRTKATRDDWRTPAELVTEIARFAPIGLDPAGHFESLVGAQYQYMLPEFDGLTETWGGFGLVYVNPPYGQLTKLWTAKAVEESKLGTEILLLCAARVETQWFHHDVWEQANAILFFDKRVAFVPPVGRKRGGGPAFPVVLVYYGDRPERFEALYDGRLGKVIVL